MWKRGDSQTPLSARSAFHPPLEHEWTTFSLRSLRRCGMWISSLLRFHFKFEVSVIWHRWRKNMYVRHKSGVLDKLSPCDGILRWHLPCEAAVVSKAMSDRYVHSTVQSWTQTSFSPGGFCPGLLFSLIIAKHHMHIPSTPNPWHSVCSSASLCVCPSMLLL